MRSGSSATDNSFSNLVGTGSNKHIVGLDEVICLFSSSCPKLQVHIQYNYVLTGVCRFYLHLCFSEKSNSGLQQHAVMG